MTLGSAEFMRRFLLHVLPSGFHRIRHYGLLANAARKHNLAATRSLLQPPAPEPAKPTNPTGSAPPTFICRHCGAPMIVIETLTRPHRIRAPPAQLAAP
jgi:Putative transposase